MAKSKKKKQKNADFSKVKLKVGKKKPSATNSTDVSFKSKAINILGQLEEKNEPTNRRNLSLKVDNHFILLLLHSTLFMTHLEISNRKRFSSASWQCENYAFLAAKTTWCYMPV